MGQPRGGEGSGEVGSPTCPSTCSFQRGEERERREREEPGEREGQFQGEARLRVPSDKKEAKKLAES